MLVSGRVTFIDEFTVQHSTTKYDSCRLPLEAKVGVQKKLESNRWI